MPTLADSYALLDRAGRDLKTLQSKTDTFVNGHPDAFIVKPNEQNTMYGVYLDPSQQPDIDWGIDFGVIANHLRSALDYIPAYLANPGKAELSQTQFPICRQQADYLRENRRGVTYRDQMLTGVPSALRTHFDAQQPYNRGDDPDHGPLSLLTWIANRHKHRKLHPCLVTLSDGDFVVVLNGVPSLQITVTKGTQLGLNRESHIFAIAPDPEWTITLPDAVAVGKGATVTVSRLGVDMPGPGVIQVNIQGNLTTEVAFGDRGVTPADLGPVIDRVQEIIDVFDPLAPVV